MHDSSIFKIRIDFDRSHDSYIYDKNTKKEFLDFFGQYASLPLGYNHEIFKSKEFVEEYSRVAGVKVTNCEIISDEAQSFLEEFSSQPEMAGYKHFHFACTGGLAIEAAIKATIDQKGSKKPVVISFRESFHGINSYGGFVTDRFYPTSLRLDGFPEFAWPKLHNPKIIYKNGEIDTDVTQQGFDKFINDFSNCIAQYGSENIVALLVEPIQATYGDNYFTEEFFKQIRELCNKYSIALIFDEIQTGLGATGKMWYYQHLGIEPDILVYGKKLQLAGIACKEHFGRIFDKPIRLEVTWDGTVSDMIRGKYILKAYKKHNILKNVNERGPQLLEGLRGIDRLKDLRSAGLLVAFDFESGEARDQSIKRMFENGFLCNKTRDRSIRLRPNLNVSSDEIEKAIEIIKLSCE